MQRVVVIGRDNPSGEFCSGQTRFRVSSRQGGPVVFLFLVVFGLGLSLSPSVRAQGAPDIVWVGTNHMAQVNAVAFSSDGRLLASGGADATIRVWQTAAGNLVLTITNGTSAVSNLVFAATNVVASERCERCQFLA